MKFSKHTMLGAAAMAALLLPLAALMVGQDPQAPRPADRGPGDEGPQRFGFGPPAFALREALDKDRDGKLSADELKASAESLIALDRNKDGKLDAQEIGWPPQFGGGRGRGGRGGGFGPGGFGGRGDVAPADFGKRILSRDTNGDGKVTADELPRSMRGALALADQNKDGSIDEAEAEKFAQRYGAIGRVPAPAQPPQPTPQP